MKINNYRIFTDINFDECHKVVYGNSSNFSFIKGKVYRVRPVSDTSFTVKDENNYHLRVHNTNINFITIEEFREQQLNKILNE